jgi:predicted RNA-binding Zn-ribbon protein involved in translation (DUF1610 family)
MEEAPTTVQIAAEHEETDFLHKLIKKGVLELKPSLDKSGVRYADAEETWNVNPREAQDIIRNLTEKGVLKAEFVDRVLTCPKCGSPDLHSKYACPRCKSYNVEFTELLEHVKCGNIGSKESFAKGPSLVCPRCNVKLAKENADYRVLGNFYQCEKCGNRFDKPDIVHVCQNCANTSTYQEAKYLKTFAYRVTEEAIKDSQRELPILDNLKKMLIRGGFKVQSHTKVKGISGAQSPFDILASKNNISLVIDVSATGNKNDIIALLAKKVDVNPTKAIIIDLSTSGELTNLGKVFDIAVFKATADEDAPADFESYLASFDSEQPRLNENEEKKIEAARTQKGGKINVAKK